MNLVLDINFVTIIGEDADLCYSSFESLIYVLGTCDFSFGVIFVLSNTKEAMYPRR